MATLLRRLDRGAARFVRKVRSGSALREGGEGRLVIACACRKAGSMRWREAEGGRVAYLAKGSACYCVSACGGHVQRAAAAVVHRVDLRRCAVEDAENSRDVVHHGRPVQFRGGRIFVEKVFALSDVYGGLFLSCQGSFVPKRGGSSVLMCHNAQLVSQSKFIS